MMQYIDKYAKYLAIALLVALFFSVNTCNKNKREAVSLQAKIDYQSQTIDSFSNTKGQQVIEQKVIETYNPEYIKELSREVFALKKELKKVAAFVQVKQEVRIERDTFPFLVATEYKPGDTLVDKAAVLFPPLPFQKVNKDYSLVGRVTLTGVVIDSMAVYNVISFRIGEKKKGIFKRETVVQVINTNQLFRSTGASSITLKQKVSPWNSWIKPVLVGAGASLITYKLKK